MMPPTRRTLPASHAPKPAVIKKYPAIISPKITRQSIKREEKAVAKRLPVPVSRTMPVRRVQALPAPVIKRNTNVTGRKRGNSISTSGIQAAVKNPVSSPHGAFSTFILQRMPAKQQAGMSEELKERLNKVGSSLLALATARKELIDTDAKVARLEETYGQTMKIQDVWRYQERAGLAAVIGQDPQAVMNAPHIFKEEERLMYNSGYPRPSRVVSIKQERSRTPLPGPTHRVTRSQLLAIKEDRLSTDDED